MPFTFAHPAIILPGTFISRRFSSVTGLIIGSMVPDFEYFIRMSEKSYYSHTLKGLFIFDLPLGIALTFIYHNLVRNSLIQHLSAGLQSRFSYTESFNWNLRFRKAWPVICISLLIGAASHIFWDNFTHQGGFFVLKYSFLNRTVSFGHLQITLYHLLQHLSTIAGLTLISIYMFFVPRVSATKNSPGDDYWKNIGIASFLFMIWRALAGFRVPFYPEIIVSFISCFLLSLTLISGISLYQKRMRISPRL